MVQKKIQINKILGISTAYNISKHNNWTSLLHELKKFGFEFLELNPEIPDRWFNDIKRSVESGEIKIVSVHNFCPLVEPLPQGRTPMSAYNFVSDDETERDMAVTYTKRTIDYAKSVNAKIVILHPGDIPQEFNGTYLHKIALDFGTGSVVFKQLKEKVMSEREKKKKNYFERLKIVIEKILNYAVSKDIIIAIENRMYAHELPNLEEFKDLFNTLNSENLKHWHDIGHAVIFSKMGLIDSPIGYVNELEKYLCGFHLHDIRGLMDHFAPGSGEIDFRLYKKHFNDKVLIIETHKRAKSNEVKNSIKYIQNILKLDINDRRL